MEENLGQKALGYLAAMVFFTVLGSFVQLKYTCSDVPDDDMMKLDDA
jgi:hypothetical protein